MPKPFTEDYDDDTGVSTSNLKSVSQKKSIFDNSKPKHVNTLKADVQNIYDKEASYKERTIQLASQLKRMLEDRTLPQNKNIFAQEIEKETLGQIMELASEINADPNEQDGIGSLSWVAQLLKTVLYQRDRINKVEYAFLALEEKVKNLTKIVENSQNVDRLHNGG